MTAATLTMAFLVLTHAVRALIRGEDASRWLTQVDAVLKALQAKDERP